MTKIKILFLASNPTGTRRLELRKEANKIRKGLRRVDPGQVFDFKAEWHVTAEQMTEHLLTHEPDIVHFSGHGNPHGSIVLEDERDHPLPISEAALTRLFETLGAARKIRCVVLNACFSEGLAETIVRFVGCVVGMTKDIDDASAIAFAVGFYDGIGSGKGVQEAFELGRDSMSASEQGPERDLLPASSEHSGEPTLRGSELNVPRLLILPEWKPEDYFIGGDHPNPRSGDQTSLRRRKSSRQTSGCRERMLHTRYTIEQELGRDLSSKVEKAFDLELKRHVAIKTLLEPAARENFVQEVQDIARLGSHPNVVALYGARLDDEHPHYVRQFVEGHSLRDLLSIEGDRHLPVNFVLRSLSALGEVMYWAHEREVWKLGVRPKGVLIQEIQPRLNLGRYSDYNILICPEIIVQSRFVKTPPDLIRIDNRWIYLPPESLRDRGLYVDDPDKANQYRLGILGYEMLVGYQRFQFASEQRLDLVKRGGHAVFPRWPAICERESSYCPSFLIEAVSRMIDPNPHRRYPSLREAIAAITRRDIDVEIARDSFRRIVSNSKTERQFFLGFYSRLLNSSPGIKDIFTRLGYPELPVPDGQQTDEPQTKWNDLFGNLMEAIVLLLAYSALKEQSEPTILSRIARDHCGYDPSYFGTFRNALIDAVVDIDKGDYEDLLRDAWSKAIDPGVKYMAEFARNHGARGL